MLNLWVQEALKRGDISGAELGRRLTARLGRSIDRAAVQKMKTGDRKVSADELMAIAEITGHEPPVDDAARATRIPIISLVQAGDFTDRDGVSSLDDLPTLAIAGLPDGDWVAFEVEGDSMDRISPPGSIIAVNRRQRQLVPNACYVVIGDNGAGSYKRFRPNPRRFEPVSTNPAHEPMFLDDDAIPRIFGRVGVSVLRM
jgi:SOS-response transcriptional repressor LexA